MWHIKNPSVVSFTRSSEASQIVTHLIFLFSCGISLVGDTLQVLSRRSHRSYLSCSRTTTLLSFKIFQFASLSSSFVLSPPILAHRHSLFLFLSGIIVDVIKNQNFYRKGKYLPSHVGICTSLVFFWPNPCSHPSGSLRASGI